MQQHGSKYWGWGQKVNIQLFQNMVMLHIKLKKKKILEVVIFHIKLMGMEHRAPWMQACILSLYTHWNPGVGSKHIFY